MRVGTTSTDDKLMLARSYVKLNAPYFSSTLYGFIPTPMENLTQRVGGPLAVSERLVLFYEPAWVDTMTTSRLAAGLAHEIMHHQLRHVVRGKAYSDAKRFNYAGDLVINQLLRKQKRKFKNEQGSVELVPLWDVGPDWLYPERFGFDEGLTADQYYHLLQDTKLPDPAFGGGCCGGIAGHSKNPVLEEEQNNARGRSAADCAHIARMTARALKQSMDGEGRGLSPGNWGEFVTMSDERFNIPWRKELPSVLRTSIGQMRSGGYDYSMRRPSLRSYLRGWPLPGLVAYDPEVALVVDSSGSMGRQQLSDAMRVCGDVLKQTGIQTAWFLEADADAQRLPQRVRARDVAHMKINGRGGTDFSPVINGFEQRQLGGKRLPKIDLLIYITDGDGGAPPVAPRNFKVIWCIVRSSWARKAAAWGKTIFIDDLNEPEEPTTLYGLKPPTYRYSVSP